MVILRGRVASRFRSHSGVEMAEIRVWTYDNKNDTTWIYDLPATDEIKIDDDVVITIAPKALPGEPRRRKTDEPAVTGTMIPVVRSIETVEQKDKKDLESI